MDHPVVYLPWVNLTKQEVLLLITSVLSYLKRRIIQSLFGVTLINSWRDMTLKVFTRVCLSVKWVKPCIVVYLKPNNLKWMNPTIPLWRSWVSVLTTTLRPFILLQKKDMVNWLTITLFQSTITNVYMLIFK